MQIFQDHENCQDKYTAHPDIPFPEYYEVKCEGKVDTHNPSGFYKKTKVYLPSFWRRTG